ncbi:DUF1294 domain-containing protein [Microaceticoccus formicicus]|uniref:DUF1294 domain-containing protein n=1 Tax=Microaceticoccus formicicus TaxID=3118105 RepID=UPI003CD00079|nr:DUF1294 domain-containing protein [Peptoniphilaceae bacterium AMB_02]
MIILKTLPLKEKALFIYILAINIIALLLFVYDKIESQKKTRSRRNRLSENTLFLVSLLGGSLGSLIAMYAFRHKTRKPFFVIGIPIIFVLNLVLLYLVSLYII